MSDRCVKRKKRRERRAKTQDFNTPPELKIELTLEGYVVLKMKRDREGDD